MSFTKVTSAGIGSTELVTLDSLEVINNASIGGVLTYEDVTNVDSIGIITARAGVLVGSGITLSRMEIYLQLVLQPQQHLWVH